MSSSMNDKQKEIEEDGNAYNKYRRYIESVASARVQLKARRIAREKGEDPNSLYVDTWGPAWEKYIKEAIAAIDTEKVVGEDSEKIESECRRALDNEIIESLWKHAPNTGSSIFGDAAKRISELFRQNENLRYELKAYVDAYNDLKSR